MRRPIRTVLFSTLYPSATRPQHGLFVETRLRELLRTGDVETQVVAPVPWFPFESQAFGARAAFARTPREESRHGIRVLHPRYPLLPRVGMSLAPLGLALGARGTFARLLSEGFDFDLIDAHYYYPDGVAAALLSRWFGKPFVVTARGSDVNLISHFTLPRRLMRWTASQAAASIGVSRGLVEGLRALGAPADRLHVMRNGVDLQRFQPVDPAEARRRLGLPADARILLSVGHLVALKGNHLLLKAAAMLKVRGMPCFVVVVGDGPEKPALQHLAAALGLAEQVRFAGAISNESLPGWYSAADALVLASSREGWANVLLESMACGTPVVATRIPGTDEVVADDAVGELFSPRTADDLAAAVLRLFARAPARDRVRQYAEGFSWDATSQAQLALFKTAVDGGIVSFGGAHA
jgi:teichuronic acid biosynthesis glycosyltransferase TuaC